MAQAPRFSLALSGGGAAGLGHIPVLEALDAASVRPQAVAGASMGALIGAGYCAGLSGEALRAHVTQLVTGWPRIGREVLAGVTWSSLGTGPTLNPLRIVEAILPDEVPERIEDLSIPLRIVTTDYYKQVVCLHDEGPIRPILAASIAIPGVFQPQCLDGRVHIDGGASDNLPVCHLPEGMPILAVDVVTNPPEVDDLTEIPGPLAVSLGALRIMMRKATDMALDRIETVQVIRPGSARFGPLEFHRARDILQAAEGARAETAERLAAL